MHRLRAVEREYSSNVKALLLVLPFWRRPRRKTRSRSAKRMRSATRSSTPDGVILHDIKTANEETLRGYNFKVDKFTEYETTRGWFTEAGEGIGLTENEEYMGSILPTAKPGSLDINRSHAMFLDLEAKLWKQERKERRKRNRLRQEKKPIQFEEVADTVNSPPLLLEESVNLVQVSPAASVISTGMFAGLPKIKPLVSMRPVGASESGSFFSMGESSTQETRISSSGAIIGTPKVEIPAHNPVLRHPTVHGYYRKLGATPTKVRGRWEYKKVDCLYCQSYGFGAGLALYEWPGATVLYEGDYVVNEYWKPSFNQSADGFYSLDDDWNALHGSSVGRNVRC